MRSQPLEAYLSRLEAELRKHGLVDQRLIEEAREHLVDAIRSGLEHGLSHEAAERDAFSTFGSPEAVAVAFAQENRPAPIIGITTVCATSQSTTPQIVPRTADEPGR
jgi:hypothetical protein